MKEFSNLPVDIDTAGELLYYMLLSRKFENAIWDCYQKKMIHGTTHLAVGEEGTAAGTCRALKIQDRIYTNHRNHAHVICKGADIRGMFAEMFGRATGLSKGRGGSMHMIDPTQGIMGSNGIVGPAPALACGSALAIKRHGEKDAVSVAFFGDGATSEGAVHEAMNLASVWSLPVMFVLENNGYGMSTPICRATRNTDLVKRAEIYDMEGVEVDGNDVFEVYRVVSEAREKILSAGRPMLVVENTYRISGHSKSDKNYYRTAEEIERWQGKDPIVIMEDRLRACGADDLVDQFEKRTDDEIAEALNWALTQPYPDVEEACADVYAK